MKSIHMIVVCAALCIHTSSAQQWIDAKYQYNSIFDVEYGVATNFLGGSDTLRMDIYTPICGDSLGISRRPLAVFVHGGAFLAGDKSEPGVTGLCKQFAARGYVAANVNYRLGFIADSAPRQCNYPQYACVFAADSAEWIRAMYRAVQDGKGAIRHLINRRKELRIDPDNVFVVGESAGSFVALGIALLDDEREKFPQAYALDPAAIPHAGTLSCVYNMGRVFPKGEIPRPDLGSIDGDVELSAEPYTIKGVGNNFGGLHSDLLRFWRPDKIRPSIYQYHQPCDLVVPIDSGNIYEGLSWCFKNGYNCRGIANTPKVYGSRGISRWNDVNSYGYAIHNEIVGVEFPFNYLFGSGSCLDQVNKPCHAFDSYQLRGMNMAVFFAGLVSTAPICDTGNIAVNVNEDVREFERVEVFSDYISIRRHTTDKLHCQLIDMLGGVLAEGDILQENAAIQFPNGIANGIYFLVVRRVRGDVAGVYRVLKE